MIRKLLITAGVLFLGMAPVSSFAADTQLTWERSQMQQVEVDTMTASTISSLSLMGQGQEIEFTKSSQANSAGRIVYQALIPTSFDLGSYVVHASLQDGAYKDLAIIKVVEFQSESYNPLTDTNTTKTLAITLFALLATWGIADSETGRRKEFDDDQTTFDGAEGGALGRGVKEHREYRKGLISSLYLDQVRSSWTILSNRFSPLLSRLISDSGYLQFSLGALVLVFPVIGGLLGGIAFKDIAGNGGISTPSFSIVASILVLSSFDAGAGLIAAIIFGLCALTSHRFGNVYDIRTFIGLSLLFISPSFIANATRSLRRSYRDANKWERIVDLVVGTVVTGWAVRCMVIALDGFAHLKLPLHAHAGTLGLITAVAIGARYLIEGYVNKNNHYYLSYLSPRNLNEHDTYSRLAGWFVKSLLFIFFAVSFLGITWQLWAALALMIFPNVLKAIKDKFPNSPMLFQVLPVGVPAMVVMYGVGQLYSSYIHSLNLDPANATKTLFVLAPLPGFVISMLKLFGRAPAESDVRWYLRPQMSALYRIGGTLLFAIYCALTFGWVVI